VAAVVAFVAVEALDALRSRVRGQAPAGAPSVQGSLSAR
jgi:hypothetical protein